ncbi:MAG TPA: caspase family protein, partial [Saprospiraceae bacterium]|nr:caspase family protein [Saprospiraceae bacterium]
LSEVFAKASPNDLVLFYFSGHGLNGSFLPIDFNGFNNKLLHEEIAAAFNKSKAKYRLLLADACHSGSIVAMRSGDPEPALVQFYKNLSKSVSGTALIMSSKADETSLESAGLRQGVFSHFLIRGLKGEADKDKNKTVTVEELFEYVSKNVRDYTGNRQSPVIKGTYDPAMPVSLVRG